MTDPAKNNPLPTQRDIDDFSAAASTGDMGTLASLLTLYGGAIIDGRDSSIQACALTWAAARGDKEMVIYLLDNGANIEDKGTNDQTALGYAATGNHPELVTYLLEKGASLEAKDRWGTDVLTSLNEMSHPAALQAIREWLDTKQQKHEQEQQAAEAARIDKETRARLENLKKMSPGKPVLKKQTKPPRTP